MASVVESKEKKDVKEVVEDVKGSEKESAKTEDNTKTDGAQAKVESENTPLPKKQSIHICPSCQQAYLKKSWVSDPLVEYYTIRREWAYCNKCLKTYPGYFVGCIQILDKDIKNRKKELDRLLKRVEYELQPRLEFEKVLQQVEKEGIHLIFTNTTRLANQIIKAMREEWGGQTQYEWIDKNRFLRVTWIANREDRPYFTPRQKALRERGLGRFSFEYK